MDNPSLAPFMRICYATHDWLKLDGWRVPRQAGRAAARLLFRSVSLRSVLPAREGSRLTMTLRRLFTPPPPPRGAPTLAGLGSQPAQPPRPDQLGPVPPRARPTVQHPDSPATMRGRQTDGHERTEIDRLAPPLPVNWHLDGEEAVTALSDPGGATTPPNVAERIYGGIVTLAYHLLGLASRGDHILARLAAIQAALDGAPHIDERVVLSTTPVKVSAAGRKHLYVYIDDALQQAGHNIQVDVNGVHHALVFPSFASGNVGGWVIIDPPTGECMLSVLTAGFTAVVYTRASDYPPPSVFGA